MPALSKTNLAQILNNAVPMGDLERIKWIVRNRDINHLYNGKTIIHLFMEHMDKEDIKIDKEFKVKKDQHYKMTYAAKQFHCLQEILSSRIHSVNLNILDETKNTPITILLKKKFEDDKALKEVIFQYFSKHKRFIDYEIQTEGKKTVREVFKENAPLIDIPKAIHEIYEDLITAVRQCDSKTIMSIVRKYDINQLFHGGKTLIHLFMENMDKNNNETDWQIQPTEENKKYKGSSASKHLQCMQEVLQRHKNQININILDDSGNTPLTILLKKKFDFEDKIKKDVYEYFLKHQVFIDFDLVTNDNQSVREVFRENAPFIKILTPIEIACNNGDQEALKVCLTDKKVTSAINEEGPLLATLVNRICKNKDYLKYQQCLESLLKIESISKQVHKVHDANYEAIKLPELANRKDVIMKLLKVSLYIGLGQSVVPTKSGCCSLLKRIKSFFEPPKFSLESINPVIIEEYLNTCITTIPKLSERHKNYSITFNYESFNRLEYNEMTLCHHLTRDPDLEHLLQHPLIHSFIFIRWQQFKLYFYISLTLNVIFFYLAIFYFTFCNGWFCVPWEYLIPAIPFLASVFINAILNWQFQTTFLVWILFLLSLIDNHFSFPHYKFLIFLSAVGLLLCLKDASHFKLSKYVYLFQRVMINFLQLLSFYAICIIGFAFAFYKNAHDLMNDPSRNSSNANISYELGFDTAPMAVLKTIVMSTGEFDAAEVDFMKNLIFILFFVTFIISISIVLSNLLIGLAVNETTEILKRADLENIIFRVKYMSRKECLTKKLQYIFKCCPRLLRLIYPPGSNRSIIIYTNRILPNNSKSIDEDNKNKLCIKMIKNDVMLQTNEAEAFPTEFYRRIIQLCRSCDVISQGSPRGIDNQSGPLIENPPENNVIPPTDKENRRWITENFQRTKQLLSIIDEAKKIASKNEIVDTAKPSTIVRVKSALNKSRSKSINKSEAICNTTALNLNTEILKSGSFEDNEKKFLKYAGGHEESSAMAVAAIVLGSISNPKDWKQNSINNIIGEGMKYYKYCIQTNVTPILSDRSVEIEMFKQQISLSCVKVQDYGFDEVIRYYTNENVENLHGVLTFNEQSYGIMKIEKFYYIFEPNMGGCAGMSKIIDTTDMQECLFSIIRTSDIVYYKIIASKILPNVI